MSVRPCREASGKGAPRPGEVPGLMANEPTHLVVRATHLGSAIDFEIGPDTSPADRDLADRLYKKITGRGRAGREIVECREHDDSSDPELVSRRDSDGRVRGIYIYLKKLHEGTPAERWVVVHFDGRAKHHLPSGESAEHRRDKDEFCTAADAVGYEARQEEPLPGRGTADVLIRGPIRSIDVEVQRSHQTRATALHRTRRNRSDLIEPIWSSDRITEWNRDNAVANIRTNGLPEGHSPRDTWLVVGGVRDVLPEQCSPRIGGQCSKLGRGRFCGGWHARLRPPERALRVYEVVERAPADDLVRLNAGRRHGFPLVTPAHRDLWIELESTEAAVRVPEQRRGRAPIHRAELRSGFGAVIDRHAREAVISYGPRCTRCESRDTVPVLSRGWYCAAHKPTDID